MCFLNMSLDCLYCTYTCTKYYLTPPEPIIDSKQFQRQKSIIIRIDSMKFNTREIQNLGGGENLKATYGRLLK